jgi:hypothetical protein
METQFIITKACVHCRHWLADVGQCRALPPTADAAGTHWPVTAPNDWCGKFNPESGGTRPPPKISDDTLVTMVAENEGTITMPDGRKVGAHATKRTELLKDMIELGMSRTPALKRIETLVARGKLEMGTTPPWTWANMEPGIYVWTAQGKKAAMPESAEEPEGIQLLALVRSLASSPETAMSLRALHREIQQALPMSLATASRKMAPLVEAGDVVKCATGYYAPMPAEAEIEIG